VSKDHQGIDYFNGEVLKKKKQKKRVLKEGSLDQEKVSEINRDRDRQRRLRTGVKKGGQNVHPFTEKEGKYRSGARQSTGAL